MKQRIGLTTLLARASLNITVLCCAAVLFCSPALAQHNLEEAQRAWPDLQLFDPAKIRNLNTSLKSDLTKRGCQVPIFTKWDGPHNVIRGSFRKPDSNDIAVLCLVDDDMSVIVYGDGQVANAEQIRKFPANAYRMIHKVSPFVLNKRAIRDKATERLPEFVHDAIDDGPVGDRAETTYNYGGNWVQVF